MGNCIRPSRRRQHQEDQDDDGPRWEEPHQECSGELAGDEFVKGNADCEKGSVKVKIVLTKEELEWFMLQLKGANGGRKLEDVLEEIERGRGRSRGKVKAWKPSLESVMESPEGLGIDM